MDKDTKKRIIGVGVAVAALLIILWYLRPKGGGVLTVPSGNDFYSPYTEWPNGIYPSPGNMNGSDEPFGSVDVSVTVPAFGSLSQDYIPIFGFTGIVAVD